MGNAEGSCAHGNQGHMNEAPCMQRAHCARKKPQALKSGCTPRVMRLKSMHACARWHQLFAGSGSKCSRARERFVQGAACSESEAGRKADNGKGAGNRDETGRTKDSLGWGSRHLHLQLSGKYHGLIGNYYTFSYCTCTYNTGLKAPSWAHSLGSFKESTRNAPAEERKQKKGVGNKQAGIPKAS
eukprot:1137669-Pelagomonas_calceolata.AAC.4